MDLTTVGIIGAGEMGTGIAQLFLEAGYPVILHDINRNQLSRAEQEIQQNLQRRWNRAGRPAQASNPAAILQLAHEYDDFGACDLIIESVPEHEGTKRRIYNDIITYLKPGALIASNTSSISITRLASATDRPDRFIGMHFMKPVPVMQLVELVRGVSTSDETYEAVRQVVVALGRKSSLAEDYPAFIVNRLLVPMINEAIYALYEGVGTVEDIDNSMKLGANHPMGPLELADFMGLDRVMAIMQVLHDGLSDSKYRPCPLLVKYVEAGWTGRKSGRGFYDYQGKTRTPTR
jgi:3-hydroxybutyryl-CoA dehydrogenase